MENQHGIHNILTVLVDGCNIHRILADGLPCVHNIDNDKC